MGESKSYDAIFKSLAEADPRGLLHLFGSLPLSVPAEVTVAPRDASVPALAVDNVYHVRTAEREWLTHYEAQAYWKADVPERLAWYGALLAFKYRMDVEVVLILLVERNAPPRIPERRRLRFGSVEIAIRYRVVRLWELAARRALAAGRPNLLPWVSLMDASEKEVSRAFELLGRYGDKNLTSQGVILSGLRYPKDRLERLLERRGAMLVTPEMFEETALYQGILEKGIEKGLEKGLDAGQLKEARRAVRLVVAGRFPELGALPELEGLKSLARIERLLKQISVATDVSAARVALKRALRR